VVPAVLRAELPPSDPRPTRPTLGATRANTEAPPSRVNSHIRPSSTSSLHERLALMKRLVLLTEAPVPSTGLPVPEAQAIGLPRPETDDPPLRSPARLAPKRPGFRSDRRRAATCFAPSATGPVRTPALRPALSTLTKPILGPSSSPPRTLTRKSLISLVFVLSASAAGLGAALP
jgi:hypothetical protein